MPLGALLMRSLSLPSPFGRRPTELLGLWVALVAALNGLAGILPYLKPVAGLSQRVAADIAAHTPPRALIVVAGVGDDAQCEVDVPYFAHRPVLSLHSVLAHAQTLSAAQVEVHTTLNRAFGAGRAVYVLDELWANRRTVAALRHQCPTVSATEMQELFAAYHPVPSWNGPRGLVWRLSPAIVPRGRISPIGRRMMPGNDRNSFCAPRRAWTSLTSAGDWQFSPSCLSMSPAIFFLFCTRPSLRPRRNGHGSRWQFPISVFSGPCRAF